MKNFVKKGNIKKKGQKREKERNKRKKEKKEKGKEKEKETEKKKTKKGVKKGKTKKRRTKREKGEKRENNKGKKKRKEEKKKKKQRRVKERDEFRVSVLKTSHLVTRFRIEVQINEELRVSGWRVWEAFGAPCSNEPHHARGTADSRIGCGGRLGNW